ncbi:RidA family protein, partial [Nonomuraea sp. RK-328]|nr:RidA family protein [Nonomuraea sp. RK-328]
MTTDPRSVVESRAVGPASGSYSQAVRVGDLLFLSGQAPTLPDGSILHGSITAQVNQALTNLDLVARAVGATLADAVKCHVYLSDLQYFDEMDAEYRRHFTHPLPARTTIQSGFTEFDVEIDAIVALRSAQD